MASRGKSKSDPLLATQTIFEALEPLAPDVQRRVLASALSLLGIAGPTSAAHTDNNQDPRLPTTTQVSEPTGRRISLVEVYQRADPATNAQRFAVFAYYREKAEGKANFSRRELEPYFKMAREKSPGANYDRDFNKSAKLGYIHESGAESYLTSKGVKAVEAGFGGKGERRGGAAKSSRNRRSGKA